MEDIKAKKPRYLGFVQLYFVDRVEAHGIENAPWTVFDNAAYQSMSKSFCNAYPHVKRINFLDNKLELAYVHVRGAN